MGIISKVKRGEREAQNEGICAGSGNGTVALVHCTHWGIPVCLTLTNFVERQKRKGGGEDQAVG